MPRLPSTPVNSHFDHRFDFGGLLLISMYQYFISRYDFADILLCTPSLSALRFDVDECHFRRRILLSPHSQSFAEFQ